MQKRRLTRWRLFLLTVTVILFGHRSSGQLDSLYSVALIRADSAYSFKSWTEKDNPVDRTKFEDAKKLYSLALQVKPNETYPANRIKEIERILYDFEKVPIYNEIISRADSLFHAEEFEAARTYYQEADSLYSKLYTKQRLTAINVLRNLSSRASHTITRIKHGTSFGMCDGYCYNETEYTNDLIMTYSKSWNKDYPEKYDTLKMDQGRWQIMIDAIDLKAFYMLPPTIGCPDCADGGAEWLMIETKTNEWRVDFNYGSDTRATSKLLDLVRPTD